MYYGKVSAKKASPWICTVTHCLHGQQRRKTLAFQQMLCTLDKDKQTNTHTHTRMFCSDSRPIVRPVKEMQQCKFVMHTFKWFIQIYSFLFLYVWVAFWKWLIPSVELLFRKFLLKSYIHILKVQHKYVSAMHTCHGASYIIWGSWKA